MFEQLKLTYDFSALEPHIDTLTMETHYGKHHAAYTNNLNGAVAKLPELAGKSIEDILVNLGAIGPCPANSNPKQRRRVLQHNLYFAILAPGGSKAPSGACWSKNTDFGGFDALKDKLSARPTASSLCSLARQ